MSWEAAAAGGGNVVGGLFSSEWQDRQNEERSRDAFERQVYLRSTAHQATVADMRNAGLNPVLSATKGATPTPSVAAPSGASGDWDLGTRVYSAYQSAQVSKSQDQLLRAQIEYQGEQATAERKRGDLAAAQKAVTEIQALRDAQALPDDLKQRAINVVLAQSQVESNLASAGQARQNTANLSVELEGISERVKALRTEGKIDESLFGEVMRIINRAVQSIRGSVPVPGR